ncbi:galactose-1-phosphate uridylyltransferase [Acidimicrobium ferrooxidans DSM 10331]|uniref:Galactose-1-phosphate uridylyltransferase n=1 Tax=Acidimicrobium ferrooxidans (strain DSM 10331 / JCM 15462 / NBRC 103882 / ICP) TaxID=525909 RepID=C7M372_ACIFD|nr:galactose-1-phosphate uridylyltransferase [Acidimicrobium ferrooxidans]ACU53466.1 galactose-1-phosphate uridylyltransferase [Acidimicrobium ferrooxidans DSM 10331]
MATHQLRLDPLTGRWVVVAEQRRWRPKALALSDEHGPEDDSRPCPFCPGNEEDTPPALETYGPSGSWSVRVVPNLYPAFEGDEPMVSTTHGPVFTSAPASGIHEVLVLTPDHDASWAALDDEQTHVVMSAIRDRIEAHSHSAAIRYSQVIVNQGRDAGASMAHPHAQLLGISFVPRELSDEQAGFARFVGGCLLCNTVALEESIGERLVLGTEHAVVIAPYWSATPFELLIVPRHHGAHLHLAAQETLFAVGEMVRDGLARLRTRLGPVAYNVVFHSSPYRAFGQFHWHAHVYPKLTTRAGFELGTGVPINVVAPEVATDVLVGDAPREAAS